MIKRKAGRPSLSSIQITTEGIALRSKSEPYIKEACIICQIVGGNVSKVAYDSTGKTMLEASKKLEDKGFFRRLNHITSAGDGIANDVVYHNNCWARVRSKVRPRKEKNDSIAHTLSEMEIINFVQTQINDREQFCLDINMVDCMFKEILLENGEANAGQDYKKKLKELVLEAIPEAVFVKQKQKNKPEQIISEGTQSNAVSSLNDEKMVGGAFQMMSKIAKCLRNEVLTHKWTFEGDTKDYTVPPLLWSFLKWVLIRPLTEIQNSVRREKLNVLVGKVTQLVSQNVKTNRQVN